MPTQNTTATPQVVYESAEGRVRVERVGCEFDLFLDGFYAGTYRSESLAAHEGAMWLFDQAQQLAADLADEQAARDAEQPDPEPTPPAPLAVGQQVQLDLAVYGAYWACNWPTVGKVIQIGPNPKNKDSLQTVRVFFPDGRRMWCDPAWLRAPEVPPAHRPLFYRRELAEVVNAAGEVVLVGLTLYVQGAVEGWRSQRHQVGWRPFGSDATPLPAGPRLLWRWEGTAAALSGYIAQRAA